MTSKVLSLFFNTPTADDKSSLLSRDNLPRPIQVHLSKKQKTFSQLFCEFFNSTSNLEKFQKKMNPIADMFRKLRTPKDVVR